MTLHMDLTFTAAGLQATCQMALPKNESPALGFILNSALKIREIQCDGAPASWTEESEFAPLYRAASRRICVRTAQPAHALRVEYEGLPAGWCSGVSEDIRALNWYSVWFPQELPFPVEEDGVTLYGCADWVLLKGTYDAQNQTWHYGGQGYDPFNLVLYRKASLHCVSNDFITVSCADAQQAPLAEQIAASFAQTLAYYNGTLFPQKTWTPLDMASLCPLTPPGGAYKRKGLIVTTQFSDDPLQTAWLNAHELAHEWCTGAPTHTWEGWLNETTAEWAALLFAQASGQEALFSYILAQHDTPMSALPPIRTADGSRPEGVHDKGTLLLYEVYRRFSFETVQRLVQLFAALETKDTAHWLAAIREQVSPELAVWLAEQLDL
ncbi:MAG: hypothetical protein PHD32_03145 [Eubacteriales bacterium]|nr:hypothetical protein [Eubacteriales bacterium]